MKISIISFLSIIFFLVFSNTNAQQKSKSTIKKEMNNITLLNSVDSVKRNSADIDDFILPPLNVLYENAKKNPNVAMLEKDVQIQQKLLTKEKKSWLKYFSARAGYTYGVTDNYGTQTDVMTPVFYQYTGMEQSYWNVGGNINFSIEDLLDYKGRVKRQKLAIEKADFTKEQTYDNIKQQIAHLYITIQLNIKNLKDLSEEASLFKGVSMNAEEAFRQRRISIDEFADAKEKEHKANNAFETLKATINEQIIILEIISKTDILNRNK